MHRHTAIIAAAGVLLLALSAPAASCPGHSGSGHSAGSEYGGSSKGSAVHAKTPAELAAMSSAERSFRAAMDKLWEDHVIWTRQFIVSAAAGLPDQQLATARLLQNQVDIGSAVKPYYGAAAGDKLTALLKDHIVIAADLVTAAKAGDTAKVTASKAKWEANADQIADFLSAANPDNWPQAHMRKMMREHLAATMAEAQARLKGDWAADIAAFDKVHTQILEMSDGLATGIVAQFPEKF